MSRKTSASKSRAPAPKTKHSQLPLCKPCWELKYCPFGILIETMPLLPSSEDESGERAFVETREQMYARAKAELQQADFQNEDDLWNNIFFVLLADPYKWQEVERYDSTDTSCRIFGHVCPVFFYGTPNVTETRDLRRRGRYIPRDIMLKVVRRDDYRCGTCGKHVDDRDIEFDHVIPHSKGGAVSVENLRVLCGHCNRRKSNSLVELLEDFSSPTDGKREAQEEGTEKKRPARRKKNP